MMSVKFHFNCCDENNIKVHVKCNTVSGKCGLFHDNVNDSNSGPIETQATKRRVKFWGCG